MITDKLINELQFKAVRSSGSGGQNVNKVSSKIVLLFDVRNSIALNTEEKKRFYHQLANRISSEGIFQLQVDENRSQFLNKKIAIDRFLKIVTLALVENAKRIQTTIPRSQIRRRLKNKQHQSGIKQNRQKPQLD